MASFVRMVVTAMVCASGMTATVTTVPANPEQQQLWDGNWVGLSLPMGRTNHTAVYDPVRQRMIVFAGDATSGHLLDVWALSLSGTPGWYRLHPNWEGPGGSGPTARYQHSAIYDPVRDRMLVFGGNDGTIRNDVWALSLSGHMAWTLLTPSGTPPPARVDHSAIYDPIRDRMVVFGGGNSSTYFNDVWALSLSGTPAWTNITPSGTAPSARVTHTAIYDPVRDRMVVFGGSDGLFRNDAWSLSLSGNPAWSSMTVSGSPPVRANHTCVYDPVNDRMVMFGGVDFGAARNDAWALSLATNAWSMLSPAGGPPPARGGHTAIYDPTNNRMVVSGGLNFGVVGDTWSMDFAGNGAWSRLTVSQGASMPSTRRECSEMFDPVRNRMILFGGRVDPASDFNDVWALPLSGDPVWTSLGNAPFQRSYHDAIYDPDSDRMIVVAGDPAGGTTWALHLPDNTWSNITPASGAPAVDDGCSVYDPVRHRILMFGGSTVNVGLNNDLWSLSLTGTPTWTYLTPTGSPPESRWGSTLVYVPQRDAVFLFGGQGASSDFNDVWMLSLNGGGTPAWTLVTPAGPSPPERFGHGAIYDAQRQRMVVYGGAGPYGSDTSLDDVWALSTAGSPSWQQLTPFGIAPPARGRFKMIYDPSTSRIIFFSGSYENGSGPYPIDPDTWALDFGSAPTAVPGIAAPGIALLAPRPNPSPGSVDFPFSLPQRMHVAIDVLDLAGRRVAQLADEDVEAGAHTRHWTGITSSGAPAASGIYFVRMTTPGGAWHRKVVLSK